MRYLRPLLGFIKLNSHRNIDVRKSHRYYRRAARISMKLRKSFGKNRKRLHSTIFTSYSVQNGCGTHPTSYPISTGEGLFPKEVKWPGLYHHSPGRLYGVVLN
jgi:hypothetical protein